MSPRPRALAGSLSAAIRQHVPSAMGVAIDDTHDGHGEHAGLDLIVLLPEGGTTAHARQVHEAVLQVLAGPVQLVRGPCRDEGGGFRSTVLSVDGFAVGVGMVTPHTLPVTERVLNWQVLWGAAHFEPLRAVVARQLRPGPVFARAQFDLAQVHRATCLNLSLGEVFAARHGLNRLVAIALGLRLFQLGRGYDPGASGQHIARDGLLADPLVREIGRASARLGGDTAQLAAVLRGLRGLCWAMLRALAAPGELAWNTQRSLEALAAAPEAWLARLDEPRPAPGTSEMDAAHHLLQRDRFR